MLAWTPDEGDLTALKAIVEGPEGTPYAGGKFKLSVQVPPRYPFEPPKVRFETRVYHPNVDVGGRICLDVLHLPPKGSWKPSWNIGAVLAAVQLLLSQANPDDGLAADASELYLRDRAAFDNVAREWTEQYAMDTEGAAASGGKVDETVAPPGGVEPRQATQQDAPRGEAGGGVADDEGQSPKRRRLAGIDNTPAAPPVSTAEAGNGNEGNDYDDDEWWG